MQALGTESSSARQDGLGRVGRGGTGQPWPALRQGVGRLGRGFERHLLGTKHWPAGGDAGLQGEALGLQGGWNWAAGWALGCRGRPLA